MNDLRFALRQLAKHPGFTAISELDVPAPRRGERLHGIRPFVLSLEGLPAPSVEWLILLGVVWCRILVAVTELKKDGAR